MSRFIYVSSFREILENEGSYRGEAAGEKPSDDIAVIVHCNVDESLSGAPSSHFHDSIFLFFSLIRENARAQLLPAKDLWLCMCCEHICKSRASGYRRVSFFCWLASFVSLLFRIGRNPERCSARTRFRSRDAVFGITFFHLSGDEGIRENRADWRIFVVGYFSFFSGLSFGLGLVGNWFEIVIWHWLQILKSSWKV